MPESFCDPYQQCEDLDGRLIIDRTIEGPPLAREEGELPLGSLTLGGGALHPYFRLYYQQHWIAKEACYGPVRSVMGLAPGETITTELRQREQTDYVRTVQTAMESSEVSTNTRRHGREIIETEYEGNSVEMSPISALFGSFLEDAWDTVTAPVRTGVDIVNGVVDAAQKGIDAIFGGGGGGGGGGSQPANSKTLDQIDETLSTVQRSESQSSRTETTTSRTVAVERAITRTFANPYRDRSLELRFIPVFRHFEVVTTLHRVDFGLLFHAGKVNFPARGMGSSYGDFLQRRVTDPRIVSVANAELGLDDDVRSQARTSAVSDHLNANSSLYTGRFLRHLNDQRATGELSQPMLSMLRSAARTNARAAAPAVPPLSRALEWSKMQVRDETVYAPLTDTANLVSALGRRRPIEDLGSRLDKTIRNPEWLVQFVRRKDVHLFMGTHIEPVAGTCVLQDLPAPAAPPV